MIKRGRGREGEKARVTRDEAWREVSAGGKERKNEGGGKSGGRGEKLEENVINHCYFTLLGSLLWKKRGSEGREGTEGGREKEDGCNEKGRGGKKRGKEETKKKKNKIGRREG